ncbi:DUF397 domain-containing protein [Streptomyces sp. NPDC050439]|uniref:DUF397 domain-containing protein n=1 Tax=unclassified Streptomyces TaxID=2593676 RepID=UPI0034285C7A
MVVHGGPLGPARSRHYRAAAWAKNDDTDLRRGTPAFWQGEVGVADGSSSGCLWRRSSYSGDSGHCVEVAFVRKAVVVRDSQNPSGSRVVFSVERWQAFLSALVGAGGEGRGAG